MTSVADISSKREQSKAGRRAQILNAARDLIRETGDNDLSMRTIARRAGVSLTTPYNLFGSKQAILLNLLEVERDFARRLVAVDVVNVIDKIFATNEVAIRFFVEDPAFYRPLWRALLDTSGKDNSGPETPERQAQTREAWRRLLAHAQGEGLLRADVSAKLLERSLAHVGSGVMLAWAMETLSTEALLPASGLSYALLLSGAATPTGRKLIDTRTALYQTMLNDLPASSQLD